jgi:hypothetical protein
MQTILGLGRHPPRHGPHLPRQQHGPCRPLRRILPIQTRRLQPRRRPHVYGRARRNPTQQWRRPKHLPNHKIGNVFGGRGCFGALYINATTAVPMRKTLEELGHPQPPTPMQTDNSTAFGVLNNKLTPKATKAIDMHFHWLQCHDAQGQFRFYWRPGSTNLADYWTKHHPASHHRTFRPEILTSQKFIIAIRKFTAAAA